MKRICQLLVLSFPLAALVSCGPENANSPGVEFMPDMYRSTSYETNSPNTLFPDSMTNRAPVAGTIARGYMPYPYPNTTDGYEMSAGLKNPIEPNAANITQGGNLYTKFCVQCHGDAGDGQGQMVKKGVWPAPPPAYSGPLKNLPEGKMMHTITHGKNAMGPHAQLLTIEERWKVIRYIQTLQGVDFATMSADSIYNARKGGPAPEKAPDKKGDTGTKKDDSKNQI